MRALIVIASGALVLSGCDRGGEANDLPTENLAVDNLMANDSTVVDAATNLDANIAADPPRVSRSGSQQ